MIDGTPKVIHKYELEFTSEVMGRVQYVDIPIGSEVLAAGVQGATLVAWALRPADEGQPMRRWPFMVCFTGKPIEQTDLLLEHLTTFYYNDVVFHIFC